MGPTRLQPPFAKIFSAAKPPILALQQRLGRLEKRPDLQPAPNPERPRDLSHADEMKLRHWRNEPPTPSPGGLKGLGFDRGLFFHRLLEQV